MTKQQCPSCAEDVAAGAIKCRHCHEELDPAMVGEVRKLVLAGQSGMELTCPHCAERITQGVMICPFCKEPLSPGSAQQPVHSVSPVPPVVPAAEPTLSQVPDSHPKPPVPPGPQIPTVKGKSSTRKRTWIITGVVGLVIGVSILLYLFFPRPHGWSCSTKKDCSFGLECIPGKVVIKQLESWARLGNEQPQQIGSICARPCLRHYKNPERGNCPIGYVCAYYHSPEEFLGARLGAQSTCKVLTEAGRYNMKKLRDELPSYCDEKPLDAGCRIRNIAKSECYEWEGYCLTKEMANIFETEKADPR